MISQREISKIAFRQHKLDKIIEKDYVISWILLGLAGSRLKKSFAFKGGTAQRPLSPNLLQQSFVFYNKR